MSAEMKHIFQFHLLLFIAEILGWIVSIDCVMRALSGELLEEEDIKVCLQILYHTDALMRQ